MLKTIPEQAALNISPEKVCFLVIKARRFDASAELVEPDPEDANPPEENIGEIEEDFAEDTAFLELKELIDDLNEDEQIDLVALAWIGRDTYDAEEWGEAVAEARRAHNNHTAEYLLGMPKLGDYLEEGLATVGYTCDVFELKHL